jgi:predicted DNA-binding transcriptional regulator YafY
MKDGISKELLRRIEFISLVAEKPDTYGELDLAEIFGISEQMIRIDAKIIREMGIMVRSRKNRYRLESNINLKTLNNLILTYFSLNQSDSIRNLKMIKDKFRDKTLSIFVNIIKAIYNRNILEIEYGKDEYSRIILRKVVPVNLIRVGRNIYMLGFEDEKLTELKSFLIERFGKIKLTSKKPSIKDYPESSEIFRFCWGSYLGGEKTKVRLLFPLELEDYFNEKFFIENQKIYSSSDGVILELEVKISYEFISWVMGWGELVKILEPDELKEEVISKAKGLLKQN